MAVLTERNSVRPRGGISMYLRGMPQRSRAEDNIGI